MVKAYTTILLSAMCFVLLHGQSMNMTLLDNWDDAALPSSSSGVVYNDCWGYNAPNGTEVAILGAYQRIYFFDVTNPSDPQVIDYFTVENSNGSTSSSVWRDFKTYQNFCYAVADQSGTTSGLLIFDLQYVPDSVVLVNQTQQFFTRAHNIWIDTDHGRLYAVGGSNSNVTILDLTMDPADPDEIGEPSLAGGYAHDIHVVNHIGYASHGPDQSLGVYDFTNPTNPTLLRSFEAYPEIGYNHSSCIDASGTRLVFADETHGKSLKLVNPNLSDPQTTNYHLFKSQLLQNNTNSVGHNPFIKDDLCFVAYYHDGVQVFDISDTSDIERVAYYDTYSNINYIGYEGCWGVYPYLQSGNIIASDIENGLFMLQLQLGVLPLEFIAFEVAAANANVNIEWKVAGPMDGERFEVQHSRDGQMFEKLEEINAVENTRLYSHIHTDPGPGLHYYRIVMKQRDGEELLTAVRAARIGQDQPFILRTSISGQYVTVDLDSTGELFMYSVDGKVMDQVAVNAEGRKELDISQIPAGKYFIAFITPDGEFSGSFIKP